MTNVMTKCYVLAQVNTIAFGKKLAQFGNDKRGVTAIEYALIGVAMATLLASILGNKDSGFLGDINNAFQKISASIASVTSPPGSGGAGGGATP